MIIIKIVNDHFHAPWFLCHQYFLHFRSEFATFVCAPGLMNKVNEYERECVRFIQN